MNQWIERIQGHAIFSELTTIEQSLEASREAAQGDTTTFEAWERIERVIKFIRTFLGSLDPALVSPALLSNPQAHTQQVLAQLNNFSSNRNVAHLNEANNQLDSVLSCLGAIPQQDKHSTALELNEAAASYKKSIGGLLRALEAKIAGITTENEALQARIQELTAEVTAQKQRADNVIVQMQQQFSTAQEARQTEAMANEAKRTEEFNATEDARTKNSESAQIARQKIFDEFSASSSTAHDQLRTELESKSMVLIKSLELQKKQAEKVVGIIGTEAVAHGYGKTANEERDAGRLWRWVAVLTLLAWIGAGATFFIFTYDKDLSLSALARQFLISTPFVLLAGFAALQVSKHQRAERLNRQQELEIAAIDPYLATFDEATRDEVKRELAEKLFGQRDVEVSKGDSKQMFDSVADTLKVVKQLLESLKK